MNSKTVSMLSMLSLVVIGLASSAAAYTGVSEIDNQYQASVAKAETVAIQHATATQIAAEVVLKVTIQTSNFAPQVERPVVPPTRSARISTPIAPTSTYEPTLEIPVTYAPTIAPVRVVMRAATPTTQPTITAIPFPTHEPTSTPKPEPVIVEIIAPTETPKTEPTISPMDSPLGEPPDVPHKKSEQLFTLSP